MEPTSFIQEKQFTSPIIDLDNADLSIPIIDLDDADLSSQQGKVRLEKEFINESSSTTDSTSRRHMITRIFLSSLFFLTVYVAHPLRDRIIYPLYTKFLFYILFHQYCKNDEESQVKNSSLSPRAKLLHPQPITPSCHFRSIKEMQAGLLPIDRQLMSNFITPRIGMPYQNELGTFFDPTVSPTALSRWFGQYSNEGNYLTVNCNIKSKGLYGTFSQSMITYVKLVKRDEQRKIEDPNRRNGWISRLISLVSSAPSLPILEGSRITSSSQEIAKTEESSIFSTSLSGYNQEDDSISEESNPYTQQQAIALNRLQADLPSMLCEWGYEGFTLLKRKDLLDLGFDWEAANAGEIIILYHRKAPPSALLPKQANVIELEDEPLT